MVGFFLTFFITNSFVVSRVTCFVIINYNFRLIISPANYRIIAIAERYNLFIRGDEVFIPAPGSLSGQ